MGRVTTASDRASDHPTFAVFVQSRFPTGFVEQCNGQFPSLVSDSLTLSG